VTAGEKLKWQRVQHWRPRQVAYIEGGDYYDIWRDNSRGGDMGPLWSGNFNEAHLFTDAIGIHEAKRICREHLAALRARQAGEGGNKC
jgi:hypothetical protein